MKENRCSSMACAFPLAGCPRSTLQDFMAIVELKKVVSRKLDLVLHDQEVNSVRDLEVVCRKRLQRYIPAICHYLGNAGQLAQNNLLLILTIQHYSSHSSYIRKICRGDINTAVFLFTYYAFSRFQYALYLTQCYKRVKKQVKFTELKSKKSIPQRPSKQSTSITNNDDTDYSPLIKDNQQTTSHNVLNNILTCDFQRASL